ncbi:hypothetical protein [Ruthenibacterium lactatiformans]|uniref:hypothetical protein n=1 Tax=Ruthenibacterium lactatiformans TaxID=1550024 RepID=UPI003991633D
MEYARTSAHASRACAQKSILHRDSLPRPQAWRDALAAGKPAAGCRTELADGSGPAARHDGGGTSERGRNERTKRPSASLPRTEQAWRAQARCMRGSEPRTAYALAALCCTVCAAEPRLAVRLRAYGLHRFFLAAAAFCLWGCADGPLRLRLRAACKGDFAAVQAAVYPTHCRWHQNGEPYRLEHADLMGAWELPDGFVLQWEGPPLFVHHSDAQAVRYILSRSYGVPYRVLRPRREPFWALCACTAGLAISLWLSGGGLRLLRQSFAPSAPLPDAPQSAAVPDFSSTNGPCFAAADGGVWFTAGHGSAVSPETTRALFTGAGRILAAETGSKVQAVLYASGPLDCSVTVTPDEGVTWFGQSLTALDRPVEYAKLEFLTPELGFAAVGTQHSPGGGEEKYAFFTHNGGQSWTAFGALPHFGTSHILSGFSMTPDGTAFLTLATGPEENWPLLYCSADSGASWQTAELPWDDCALAYLNHLSRAEQRPEGFYVLLTQLPYSGGNAAFFAPTAQGPWSYAGDAIPDA